uniref:Uncharacterized protein n=1 Tax=Zea mays TaxID=4577 RepID=A0A804PRN8_MAIZE
MPKTAAKDRAPYSRSTWMVTWLMLYSVLMYPITLSRISSASASLAMVTWHASSTLPTVMAQMCSSWTATTPSIPQSPLSSLVASISRGVLSINTSRMLRSIRIVVNSTTTEKTSVQMRSMTFHSGLYQMIAPPTMTPTLWTESPSTWSDSASMAVLVVMDTALFLLLVVVVGMAIVRIPMAVAMVMRMSMSMAVAVPVVMAQQHGHENVDGQPERRHGEHERPPHVAALADEPHDGLVHQYAGEQPDELDGDEGAEDLHPEEPVRLPRRRLPPGGPEREQRDGERRHVRQEVRRVGQDGQAVRLDAPHHLHRHEYDAEDHRDYQLPHRRRPLPGVLRGVAGVGEVAGCALAELAPCRSRS